MSHKEKKRRKRKTAAVATIQQIGSSEHSQMSSRGISDHNSDETDMMSDDINLECSSSKNRNKTAIPNIAFEADRYGVSNRAAAAISTATLVDYGIISSEDNVNVIDHRKV